MVEKFEVRNRWTNKVQFTAEIACSPDASVSIKLGLAVRWARKNDADLSDADLRDADLRDAVLSDAVLSGADLSDADLSDADLRGAVLSDAVLSGADLSDADLRGAALRGADLRGAVLRGAVLRGADLSGADLRGAVLSGADLRGAVLSGAVLRSFKTDFWAILLTARPEVPGLISALTDGRVDGSTYKGDCACLVGTIANVRGVDVYSDDIERDAGRPAEQWFAMICKGDKPGDDTAGGFAAKVALEWAEEFQRLTA